MELDQIRALDAIAAAGSLLGASQQLDVSRARLRLRLKALEDELGARLLTRSPRGVELTDIGRDFLDRARPLVREADALRRFTIESQQSALDELRVCVPTGVPPIAVTTLLGALRARHPGMAVRLSTRADPLAASDTAADVFVHFGDAVTAGSYRTFAMRRLTLRLMASPAYLDRRGRPDSVGALADHTLLLWLAHSRPADHLPLSGPEGFRWIPWFSSPDCFVVRTVVEAGHGIALLPEGLADFAGRPGGPLELVLPEAVVQHETVRVLLPERSAETARARAVVEVLRAVTGGGPTPPG